MEILSVATEGDLYRFLEEHGNNRVKRELLAFLGRHPNARFTRYVMCYALDCGKLEVERALRALIEAELVDMHGDDSLTLYSLTRNEEKRQPVLELASLGWDQWQLMIRLIERKDKLVGCQSASV
jgi:hypothetical protein